MKYEVRCCCDPDKLVGWLETERDPNDLRYDLRYDFDCSSETRIDVETVRLEVAQLNIPINGKIESYSAIKDNHLSIETLR